MLGLGEMKVQAFPLLVAAALVALAFSGAVSAQTATAASVALPTDRTVLPIPEPQYSHSTVLDARNATPPPRFEVKALTPDKPFFIYFAPGAVHGPHHVPREWIAKYKGKFDAGWDALREQTLARQIKLGVVPPDTKLAPKPEDWAALSADEKKLFARQMEVFAGFGEYADTEIRRLVEAIKASGQLDNTLIFYIVGDNGASAEGGMNGLFNEMSYFNGVDETVQDILKHYDELGSATTYGHYAAGWAVAGDTPFIRRACSAVARFVLGSAKRGDRYEGI